MPVRTPTTTDYTGTMATFYFLLVAPLRVLHAIEHIEGRYSAGRNDSCIDG